MGIVWWILRIVGSMYKKDRSLGKTDTNDKLLYIKTIIEDMIRIDKIQMEQCLKAEWMISYGGIRRHTEALYEICYYINKLLKDD